MSWACTACGTANDDAASACVVCGAAAGVPTVGIVRADPPSGGPAPGGGHPSPNDLPPTSSAPLGAAGPGAMGAAAPPPSPAGRRGSAWPIAIAVVVSVLAVVAGIVVVATAGGGSDDASDRVPVETVAPSEPASTASTPTSAATTTPVERKLAPISARPSAIRSSAELKCTGEIASYSGDKLIDGDLDTGWGAGEDDGTGQTITVTFPRPVHLTRIELTPGFAKVGPRADVGCGVDTPAFGWNRFVTAVRYRFDDGSTKDQQFVESPAAQPTPVDVETASVVIEILGTDLPPGADDDTVLSEATFYGWEI